MTRPYPKIPRQQDLRARAAVRPLAERAGLTVQLKSYRGFTWTTDVSDRPTLYLDDVSEIPFLDGIDGVEEYQHRARVRAGDGDLVAAVTPPVPKYLAYCRDRLRLGNPDVIVADVVRGPLAVTEACGEGTAFRTIANRARGTGLAIHPYMSIEATWRLARRIRDESRQDVSVLGPPPPVTWLANDKAKFAEIVRAVLGNESLVEMRSARTTEAMTRHLVELASEHERVALKRVRCASGMGNHVFQSKDVLGKSFSAAEAEVTSFLQRTLWRGREDVLVVVWEDTEVSPSAQLWIPPPSLGPPILEGVYEQLLSGIERVFQGSRPSTLPTRLNTRIGEAALQLASALQEIGYVGRCSFDLLVVGDPQDHEGCRVLFVECNGRWGGTSIPMRLVDRVTGGERPPYRAQDVVSPRLIGLSFAELRSRFSEALYDPASGRGRFVLYNIGPLARWGKIDAVAIGRSQAEAEEALEEELPERLGLR